MLTDMKLEKLRKGEITFHQFQYFTVHVWKDTWMLSIVLSTKQAAS